MTKEEQLRLALQITRGLQYFHSKKVLFRNLTSAKIVLDPVNLSPKFVGLSCCDFIGNNSKLPDPYLDYLAPEQLTNALNFGGEKPGEPAGLYLPSKISFTEQADIFACGLVLCEIFSQQKHKVEFEGLIDNHREAEKMLQKIGNLNLLMLCKDCLSEEPKQRPSLVAIIATIEKELMVN